MLRFLDPILIEFRDKYESLVDKQRTHERQAGKPLQRVKSDDDADQRVAHVISPEENNVYLELSGSGELSKLLTSSEARAVCRTVCQDKLKDDSYNDFEAAVTQISKELRKSLEEMRQYGSIATR